MEIVIHYKNDLIGEFPCWARATINGKGFMGCGYTWKEAKQSLLNDVEKVRKAQALEVPADESVEVEVANV